MKEGEDREVRIIGVLLLYFFILLPVMTVLFIIGLCLTDMEGGGYLEDKKKAQNYTEEVTAVVFGVERAYTDKGYIGYQNVSYEYNGQKYISKVKYDAVFIDHYSVDSGKASVEHINKLRKTVDTEVKIYIDPKEPSKASYPISDEKMRTEGILALIGVFCLLVCIILFVVFVILLRRLFIMWSKHKLIVRKGVK